MPIRVVLVDDHPTVRSALRAALGGTGRVLVVAEGADGDEAYALYGRHRPDVIVLDLHLPKVEGLEAIRRIRASDPAARILVFSMTESALLIGRALRAGAMGYLSKRGTELQIVEAVFNLAEGKPYLDPEYARNMAYCRLFGGGDDPLSELSQREFQIFQCLANGDSTREIADKLFISIKTVGAHQTNIMKKLGVKNIAQLVRLAMDCGVLAS